MAFCCPQEFYACSIAESQNPFSNIVHLSHTSLHSFSLIGDGASAMTRASIAAVISHSVYIHISSLQLFKIAHPDPILLHVDNVLRNNRWSTFHTDCFLLWPRTLHLLPPSSTKTQPLRSPLGTLAMPVVASCCHLPTFKIPPINIHQSVCARRMWLTLKSYINEKSTVCYRSRCFRCWFQLFLCYAKGVAERSVGIDFSKDVEECLSCGSYFGECWRFGC